MKQQTLWVVEMLVDGVWLPTSGVAYTRREGRDELHAWQGVNADDQYRLRQYWRKG